MPLLSILYGILSGKKPHTPGIMRDVDMSLGYVEKNPRRDYEMEQERQRKRYWDDHYYSLDLDCFVKERPSGTMVRSVPFIDWIDGVPDDTGEIVKPTDILNQELYELWESCDSYEEFRRMVEVDYPQYLVSDDDDGDDDDYE